MAGSYEMEIKVGAIVEFKGKGPVYEILSHLLKLFERDWDRWGWHLTIASKKVKGGWFLIEALAGGVQEKFHSQEELAQNTRVYPLPGKPPTQRQMEKFREIYLGYPYDVKAYFFIVFAYIIQKITRYSFRIIDTTHLCWETAAVFRRFFGQPLQPNWEYPVVSRMIQKLKQEATYGK